MTGTSPGYVYGGNGTFSTTPSGGNIQTGVPPTPDPFRSLAEPNPSSLPLRSSDTLSIGNGAQTLQPGRYIGGISLSSGPESSASTS